MIYILVTEYQVSLSRSVGRYLYKTGKKGPINLKWKPPPRNFITISFDASRIQREKSASIWCIVMDNRRKIIITKGKKEGRDILQIECLAVQEGPEIAAQMRLD